MRQPGKRRERGARGGVGRGRVRKAALAVLTVTDVRFVVVFLRGGIVPPPATCRATGLGRQGTGMPVMEMLAAAPEHVLCEAPSASPTSLPPVFLTAFEPIPTPFYRPGN